MARPITLFTGQWADLPFEEVCRLASEWGYDGLEIACWGDHFEVDKALADDSYVERKRETLAKHNLEVFTISNHLVGQAVCDHPIDERHQDILPGRIWGDGEPEGVRQRAAEEIKDTARAAAKLGVKTVVGFTGSSIWHTLAMFPPVPPSMIERGYQDFADRWNPILDVFDEVGVRFAHEVHPSEIAYDYWTTKRTLEAIGNRPAFGLNWDPSHFVWQELDPVNFIFDFADRIYHVDCKDAKVRTGDGRRGRLASHLPWADLRRGWDFVSTGHGDVPWEDCFRALERDRLHRPDLDRVGGRRHGPARRRPGGVAVRPPAGLRRPERCLRRGVQQQGLTAPRTDHGPVALRRPARRRAVGQSVLAFVPEPDGLVRGLLVDDGDPEVVPTVLVPALAPTVAGVPANASSAAVSSCLPVLPLPLPLPSFSPSLVWPSLSLPSL